MSGLSLSVAGELCNDWSRVCACLGGGSILPGGGGVSVCALHGGSRLLLHYQLLRKPAAIFSLFLPVSNAKGHPIVSGVTHICNFYCCLICIKQLVRWNRQNYLFIWSNECYCSHDDLVFHRLQDLFCLHLSLIGRRYLIQHCWSYTYYEHVMLKSWTSVHEYFTV